MDEPLEDEIDLGFPRFDLKKRSKQTTQSTSQTGLVTQVTVLSSTLTLSSTDYARPLDEVIWHSGSAVIFKARRDKRGKVDVPLHV